MLLGNHGLGKLNGQDPPTKHTEITKKKESRKFLTEGNEGNKD